MRTPAEKLERLKIRLDMIDDEDQLPSVDGTDEPWFDDWEKGFLRSVCEQVEIRGANSLSAKQQTRIHEIFDKYFEP